MEVRSLAQLLAPDERTLRFTSMGLSTGGMLAPEAAAEFEQRAIASADLVEAVPDGVRASFERLRTCHSYGVVWYDAFTVASDLSSLVLEQALRERFIEFYGGSVPVGTASGQTAEITVRDFTEISDEFRRGGKHAKAGWSLRPKSPGSLIPVPLTLEPLMRWARREGLLHGQRNKRLEPLLAQMRNRFAHGTGFRVGMPNHSARDIRDLAEIINRLWGAATPGGRLYPAPRAREVVAVGWTHPDPGRSRAQLSPEQIPAHVGLGDGDWAYLLLLAVPDDEQLWDFDARYELTTFPCELLWGPGDGAEAFAWWQSTTVAGDSVDYLDRLFAVRVDGGKTYLPQRPDAVAGLRLDRRGGVWHLVRSDFPLDAFAHVRHLPRESCSSADEPSRACPVEDVAVGTWSEIRELVREQGGSTSSGYRYTDAHVPRSFPLEADVGCD